MYFITCGNLFSGTFQSQQKVLKNIRILALLLQSTVVKEYVELFKFVLLLFTT